MGKNSKLIKILVFIVITMMSLVGCMGAKENDLSKEKKGESKESSKQIAQELKIGYGKDTGVQSPDGTGDMLLKIFVGERLVEFIDGEIKPGLAKSWDIKDGGKCITFNLREDVKFSDGTPLTSKEVKMVFDRSLKFESYHWTEMERIEKIEANEPYKISFYYKDGQQGYLALTGFAEYGNTIIGPGSFEKPGDPATPMVKFIGTGPFKVSEYKKDQYTVFEPNKFYLGTKPKLSKVTVNIMPNAKTRVLAIQSGDVDALVDYYHGGSDYTPRNMLSTLKKQGFEIHKQEMPMTTTIAFNYEKEPWKNVKVRQAINYAINKDEVVSLFDGWINPAKDKMFSEKAPFIKDSKASEYKYDVEKAKQLLKEAGIKEGYKTTMILQGDNPDEIKMGEIIKAQLSKIGIDVQLESLEKGIYTDKKKAKQWDMCIYYIGGPERRAYTRMDGRFNSNAPEFGGSGYFTSESIITTLKKAVESFDEKERKENFNKFYQIVNEQACGVPLYYDAVFVVAKPEVKNIKYISTEPRFENVYIQK